MSRQNENDPRRTSQPVSDAESGSFEAPQTPAAGSMPDAETEPGKPKDRPDEKKGKPPVNQAEMDRRGGGEDDES
jgi:hypothetical protein